MLIPCQIWSVLLALAAKEMRCVAAELRDLPYDETDASKALCNPSFVMGCSLMSLNLTTMYILVSMRIYRGR